MRRLIGSVIVASVFLVTGFLQRMPRIAEQCVLNTTFISSGNS